MRFNSHPCADMMTDLFKPYREVLEVQRKSKNPHFRKLPKPSFLAWKLRGMHCEEWVEMFIIRERLLHEIDPLHVLDDHVNGDGKLCRSIELWIKEREQLLGLEYHF